MPEHALVPDTSALHRLLLTPGLARGMHARVTPPPIATGVGELDALLGGGIPRGALTEVVGGPSSGRTTLACTLLRAATVRRALAVCIDLPDAFDPVHAEAAGVALARVLWIRPRTAREALRATEHVLDGDGFAVVLLDLDDGRPHHAVAPSVWLRFARAAMRTRTAVVVVGSSAMAGTFASLRLEIERRGTEFDGDGPCALFAGVTSRIHVRKTKRAAPATSTAAVVVAAG
jgi:RecA/RadA recombinase